MTDRPHNWAGNITYSAERLHRPGSVSELQDVVAASRSVRALGTGHSFNRIADCADDMVSVAGLPPVVAIDAERAMVTAAAGLRYGELAGYLYDHGYALANLGSLPHISIAGACATGTHGSGVGNGCLATSVSALEMVTADGRLVGLGRDDAEFDGAVVALGALGVLTSLTLDIVPAYEVAQYVYDDVAVRQLDEIDDILSSAYSVSLFTDWQDPGTNQLWVKARSGDGSWSPEPGWLGATPADGPRHPVPGLPVVNCTDQLGVPGPWHERLPHFRLEFTPSSGDELQSEFLLPRECARAALAQVRQLGDLMGPVLQISEVRTVAADRLWLSPCYGRDTVGIHFTWVNNARAVAPVLAAVEQRLAPFEARPHWGKLFTTSPEVVRGRYERADEFAGLQRQYDPGGKFRNEYIERYITAGD